MNKRFTTKLTPPLRLARDDATPNADCRKHISNLAEYSILW
jgi:hypothetical protein